MTATKSPRAGLLVAALLLGGSVALNIYLWRRSAPAASAPPLAATTPATKSPAAPAGIPGVPTLDFAKDADLPALRDALYAAGATETRARQILYGVLRRQYRAALSEKRRASIARGWWRDETRTRGITQAAQSLQDEHVLLKSLVDDKIEALFGLDPAQRGLIDARYSYMPEETRLKLARLERERQLPGQWVPTGDPEVDAKTQAQWTKLLEDSQVEKDNLLAGLDPAQRREHDLRYGALGMRLAREYGHAAGSTEAEFRTLHRIVEENAGVPSSAAQRAAEINRRIGEQMVAELGYDRTVEYLWSSTPEYRALANSSAQTGLPPATMLQFAQLATETGHKANAMHRDAALSVEQRRAALLALQQSARAQVDALLPADTVQKLPPAALSWLNQMSSGQYRLVNIGVPGRTQTSITLGNITGNAPPAPVSILPATTAPARATSR